MSRRIARWASLHIAVWCLLTSGVTFSAQAQPQAISVDLEPAAAAAAGLPRLRSLLVSWRGELVLEQYFHGAGVRRLANIKSASKSVISALVGIAIDRGVIDGVQTPIAQYFPELREADADPLKRQITIEDLLAMKSGLVRTSGQNYGNWVASSNWVRYILSRPLSGTPGEQMDYSTGNTHLLSAILTKASGKSTWEFAQEVLGKPLGITLARWLRDPQGIYFGGNDMQMTPRQMVAFGELYLNRGRVNGQQILSPSWVEASWVPRGRSRFGSDRQYGYGWWIRDMAGYQVDYAWGYGGQFVFVVPDLDLVVVTTSSTSTQNRRGHLERVYDLVERFIVRQVAAATEAVPVPPEVLDLVSD